VSLIQRLFNCLQLVKKSKLPAKGLLPKPNHIKLTGLVGRVILVIKLLMQSISSNCSQLEQSKLVILLPEQSSHFRLGKTFRLRIPSNFFSLISKLLTIHLKHLMGYLLFIYFWASISLIISTFFGKFSKSNLVSSIWEEIYTLIPSL